MEDIVAQYRSSLRSPSCNVSTDNSKVNFPKTCDLFRPLSASVSSLKVIQWLHTSSTSSSSCLSFINLLYEAVSTEDVTNPVSLPSVYCIEDVPFFLDIISYFFTLHEIGPTDLFYPFAVPNIRPFKIFIYLPKFPHFSTNTIYCS